MKNIKLIVTHPGIFHGDETCVVGYIRKALGKHIPVERRVPTQVELDDPEILVADVGGQHSVSLSNFDHHQKGGAGERWDSGVPYAAFGLVYDFLRPTNEVVAARFEERMVLPVDAADCMWGTQEGTRPSLSFSACVSGFNPGAGATPAERNEAFEKAVAFATQVMENELSSAYEWAEAKKVVLEAKAEGSALILDKFVPWGEHIFGRPDVAGLLYVIFPSERGGYSIQQVPVEAGSPMGKKPLPATWAGLREGDLDAVTGIPGGIFCHDKRFIGGHSTYEGAIAMVELAAAE